MRGSGAGNFGVQAGYLSASSGQAFAGIFTVTAALTDTLARLAQVTFPDTTSPGISYTLSGVASATRFCTYIFTTTSTFSATTHVTATDRATNVGASTFTVTRDTTPPTFTLTPAVENGALRVTWSTTDPSTGSGQVAASGVDGSTCELHVQEDEGAWQPFSTVCAGDEVHGAAQPGHVYTFRLSASDNVSNSASTEAVARFPRVTKYYYHGGRRVAMRADGVVYYLHGDHLGSTSLTTDASGAVVARQLYHPYGTVRYSEGTLPTDFGFTGQRDVPGTGLIFMHARYYHAGLGRWTQADSIVPNVANPQEWNRYGYCLNNPTRYIDPNGHQIEPPQYQPNGISYTGTTGPYVSSADTTVQYSWPPSPPQLYWTAAPPRQARSSAALLQAQRDVRAGSTILWGIGAIGAFGGAAAGAAGGGQGDGYAGNMPPGQAVLGDGPSGRGNAVLPLDTAIFRLSREGEFAARNFPHNLAQIRPMPTGGRYDAHHMLAKTFKGHPGVAQALVEVGVSIHDPRWGAWWERGPEGTHQQKWSEYNQKWNLWLTRNPIPSFDQLVGQAEGLAQEYELDWSGDTFYCP